MDFDDPQRLPRRFGEFVRSDIAPFFGAHCCPCAFPRFRFVVEFDHIEDHVPTVGAEVIRPAPHSCTALEPQTDWPQSSPSFVRAHSRWRSPGTDNWRNRPS